MAAASDKARFYLEQCVPELREYEAKRIFSRDEIASIAARRSHFEHALAARGSTPADYARYVAYEMNLDALRKKRCRRQGVKSTAHAGQRTLFFLLDRATNKFPGDLGLWMQYIDFCRREGASRKLAHVFTRVLRLHPKAHGLWVLAAKHYAETQGDAGTARNYLQRGLRFCPAEQRLWLEYARLEMVYLAKLAARRKILGLDAPPAHEHRVDTDENTIAFSTAPADFETPSDADEATAGAAEANEDLLKTLDHAPAFTGGIPIAIFDAAMTQFGGRAPEIAHDFFDLISAFDHVPSTPRILDHILAWLRERATGSVASIICEAQYELFRVDRDSADFPAALSRSLARITSGRNTTPDTARSALAQKAVFLLLPLLRDAERLDADVRTVVELSVTRHLHTALSAPRAPGAKPADATALSSLLRGHGKPQDADTLLRIASAAAR